MRNILMDKIYQNVDDKDKDKVDKKIKEMVAEGTELTENEQRLLRYILERTDIPYVKNIQELKYLVDMWGNHINALGTYRPDFERIRLLNISPGLTTDVSSPDYDPNKKLPHRENASTLAHELGHSFSFNRNKNPNPVRKEAKKIGENPKMEQEIFEDYFARILSSKLDIIPDKNLREFGKVSDSDSLNMDYLVKRLFNETPDQRDFDTFVKRFKQRNNLE